MSAKTSLKPLLDGLMALLFLLLMADRHTGNAAHEYLGLVLAAAFLLHTRLNGTWYRTLFPGRYDLSRSIRFLLNLLLLLAFAGTLTSAVVISKTVFSFPGFKGELFSRTVHIFFAHWSFVLAAIHLGLYRKRLSAALRRHGFARLPGLPAPWRACIHTELTGYGAYADGAAVDPAGAASGAHRINKGGGWNDFGRHLRSAYRAACPPDNATFNLGFRLARNAQ